MADASELLLRDVVRAARTSAPMWPWVDAAQDALDRARADGAPRIVHWRLAWARRIARLGCDLGQEYGLLALDGWELTDVIESARRLVPAWIGHGAGHPGLTLDMVSEAPADPRPHLDVLIALAGEHGTLEPGFALIGRLIELNEPTLALRVTLASTWPATLNFACMPLEQMLNADDLRRLAHHAFPHLKRWPDEVGHAGYGIEPRAWLAPHLEPDERERTLREIEEQVADPMVQDSQDFESPTVSLIRALARVGESQRARDLLARSELSDWDLECAERALEPEDVERRRETIRRRFTSHAGLDVTTPEALIARRARAIDSMVKQAALQLGYSLSRSLREELRPALVLSVEPRLVERLFAHTRIDLDASLEGSLDDAWRGALDDVDTPWRRLVALAEAEEGETLVRAMVETVTSTLDG